MLITITLKKKTFALFTEKIKRKKIEYFSLFFFCVILMMFTKLKTQLYLSDLFIYLWFFISSLITYNIKHSLHNFLYYITTYNINRASRGYPTSYYQFRKSNAITNFTIRSLQIIMSLTWLSATSTIKILD